MENKAPLKELKVYGILLDYSDANFISIQCAYSLEEAFVLAKVEYEEQSMLVGGSPTRITPQISIFAIKTLEELKAPTDVQKMQDAVKIIKKGSTGMILGDGMVPKNREGLPSALGPMGEFNLKEFMNTPSVPIGGQETGKPKDPVTAKKLHSGIKDSAFKNVLMKEIIDNNNKELYEKNKDIFTDAEKGYILERLK